MRKHQGSRRVGPPQIGTRQGFMEPITSLYWALAGIAYMTAAFWAWVISNAPPKGPETIWF